MATVYSKQPQHARETGVTLFELLITLSIVVILLTVAVPGFQQLISSNRMTAVTNEFVATLSFSRSEAIKRSTRVGVCRSVNGASCAGSGSWDQGWIIFVDGGTVGVVDGSDTILRIHTALSSGSTLIGNTNVASYISYVANGFSSTATGAMQAGTIEVCNPIPTTTEGRDIVISASGRVRVINPSATCT
jgi:type IV fimbrial biogenesis protein FimT